jgi:hypothetical protein
MANKQPAQTAGLRAAGSIAAYCGNGYNRGTNPSKVRERLIRMSQAKKKPPMMKTKPKEEVNKKALIWIGSIFIVIVIVMAILLILNT